ncbi:hypothetical protein EDD22DRAFT_545020 [Suillus occidentalis]|nr:hypothetical protein EDD22DRAFT_545020 [Suillus occidentalis]
MPRWVTTSHSTARRHSWLNKLVIGSRMQVYQSERGCQVDARWTEFSYIKNMSHPHEQCVSPPFSSLLLPSSWFLPLTLLVLSFAFIQGSAPARTLGSHIVQSYFAPTTRLRAVWGGFPDWQIRKSRTGKAQPSEKSSMRRRFQYLLGTPSIYVIPTANL